MCADRVRVCVCVGMLTERLDGARYTSVHAVVHVVHIYMQTNLCIHDAHKCIDIHTFYILTEILDGSIHQFAQSCI